MRMNLSAIVFVASASTLLAQEYAKPAAKPAIQLQAEVVSVDTQARTMVIKPSGANHDQERATLSVDTKASAALQGLHQGDHVALTCRPSTEAGDAGERKGAADFAKTCGMVTGIAQTSIH